jgi:hypothetical protein
MPPAGCDRHPTHALGIGHFISERTSLVSGKQSTPIEKCGEPRFVVALDDFLEDDQIGGEASQLVGQDLLPAQVAIEVFDADGQDSRSQPARSSSFGPISTSTKTPQWSDGHRPSISWSNARSAERIVQWVPGWFPEEPMNT